MKKWMLVLPLVFSVLSAHAGMTLEEKIVALERAIVSQSVKNILPVRFEDELKQAEFEQNLKEAVVILEEEMGVIPVKEYNKALKQVKGKGKFYFENLADQSMAFQEAALLVYFLETSVQKMEAQKGQPLTEPEISAISYVLKKTMKNSYYAKDFKRYVARFSEEIPTASLTEEMVENAKNALFKVAAEKAQAKN
ncbi:hypothetical protein [Candidatus Avelusimicrobium sp.]